MDTRKLSRYTGAAILTLAPIGFVAGAWTEPFYDNDAPAAAQLAEVADQPMPAGALRVLVTLLILLMPVAMIYAMRLARRGAPRLAAIGGAISFLAWSAGIASIGAVESLYWHGSRMADRGAVAAVIDAATGDAVFNTLIAIFVLGHLVGMLTLGIGLWRSRAVPAWVGILFALSPILHAVGDEHRDDRGHRGVRPPRGRHDRLCRPPGPRPGRRVGPAGRAGAAARRGAGARAGGGLT